LVTKQSKLKLYKTAIRPIVTYATETWVLKETVIQKLLAFERRILRRIFGSTKENQIWRVETNEELDKLINHENIIIYIKAQRLSWFGHVKKSQIPEQLRRYLIGNP
jgi:F0F1-type ATP synthase alpha subunit